MKAGCKPTVYNEFKTSSTATVKSFADITKVNANKCIDLTTSTLGYVELKAKCTAPVTNT